MADVKELAVLIQTDLKARGFDLGRSGPNRDGVDGDPGQTTLRAVLETLRSCPKPAPVPQSPAAGPVTVTPAAKVLTQADVARAAQRLMGTSAQVWAVVDVESGGGWFTDVRAAILDLDGPGGFIDGDLLKILFEAHWFDHFTGGRFRKSHPNISSAKWNRALYVGGQGEWARLHLAMSLDREAALKSASVGAFQIMGFNHARAGFATVEQFWEAHKSGIGAQLDAFVTFILADKNLTRAFRALSTDPEACRGFARLYNGDGYEKNAYHTKLAARVKARQGG